MDLGIYGFFHFYDDIDEMINTIKSINIKFFGFGIGKFIILKDQVLTKDNRILGKKGKISYAFTSMFSDKTIFNKILEDGIIKKENCINLDDVNDNEFDDLDNLKKAKTLNSLREFMEYIKEHDLK